MGAGGWHLGRKQHTLEVALLVAPTARTEVEVPLRKKATSHKSLLYTRTILAIISYHTHRHQQQCWDWRPLEG